MSADADHWWRNRREASANRGDAWSGGGRAYREWMDGKPTSDQSAPARSRPGRAAGSAGGERPPNPRGAIRSTRGLRQIAEAALLVFTGIPLARLGRRLRLRALLGFGAPPASPLSSFWPRSPGPGAWTRARRRRKRFWTRRSAAAVASRRARRVSPTGPGRMASSSRAAESGGGSPPRSTRGGRLRWVAPRCSGAPAPTWRRSAASLPSSRALSPQSAEADPRVTRSAAA